MSKQQRGNEMGNGVARSVIASSLICALSGCALVGCRLPQSEPSGESSQGSDQHASAATDQHASTDLDPAPSVGQPSSPAGDLPLRADIPVQLAAGATAANSSVGQVGADTDSYAKAADEVALVIRGVDPGKGPVMIAVFDSAANFPNHENATLKVSLDGDGPVIESSIAIAGEGFAIAAYQDQDGNGKLSKAAFGIPTEPYGFSNNAKGSMGPPSYQSAAVDRSKTKQVEITLTSLSF